MKSSQFLRKKINHVAIIMDGNGRWSQKRKVSKKIGHEQGVKNCIKICKNLDKIEYRVCEISFYVFSTENWSRSKSEIDNLFNLIEKYYLKFSHVANENNLVIRHYGSRKKLSKKLINIIDEVTKGTSKNTGTFINLMFNYGSRQEINDAIEEIRQTNSNKFNIRKYLYTGNSPDPDLIIRTGGEKRLSNFMLWQSAYSELFFTKTLWPDFSYSRLNLAISEFFKRKRNYGK